MTELQKRLITAGYPIKEMYHHYSDLYIFVNDTTQKVIDKWCKDFNYKKDLFVSTFTDNITGRLMYDVAFQWGDINDFSF